MLADRACGVLVLGTAIPFGLGLLHLLYGPACLAVALACAVAAMIRAGSKVVKTPPPRRWYALPFCATLFVAMPALQQPPMDGDTLAYHLPSALAWVHAHSIWTTATRYWWYPGGSELFAAGIAAVGGWWLVGLAGTCAAFVLVFRLTDWGISLGTPQWVAASLASAFVCTGIVAAQAADLQNDVWLAALFVEALWVAHHRLGGRISSPWLLPLVKPTGSFYALVVVFCRRRPLALVALGLAPLCVWLLRDALLWSHAIVPPASTATQRIWSTSIASHGLRGLAVLGQALWRAGAPTIAWFFLPVVGLFVGPLRRVAIAGTAATAIFWLLPFGFNSSVPQLAGGDSLRFDLPAMATGCVVAAALAARMPLAAGMCALAATAAGGWRLAAIFWNDADSHRTALLVAAVAACALLPKPKQTGLVLGAALCMALVDCGVLAASRAYSYYDAWLLSPNGVATAVFPWLTKTQPSAIVVWNLRAGAVAMMAKKTTVYDALDAGTCAQARKLDALLLLGTDPDISAAMRRSRLGSARACGSTRYEDPAVLVVQPRGSI